jgi:rhodanese-related sulfurtransferase
VTSIQWIELALVFIAIFFFVRRAAIRRSVPRVGPAEYTAGSTEKGADVYLDVRTAAERSVGQIPGSLHIPLQELRKRIGELARYQEKRIICYCQSGSRSLVAASILNQQGFNAASMDGGITEWKYRQLK